MERAAFGEISASTIPNYYRATKLFREMNDMTLILVKKEFLYLVNAL
jgi:hypothetical protein